MSGPSGLLSYSAGVTIVSGPSSELRRSVIADLFSQATKPVAVVTVSSPAEHVGEIELEASSDDGISSDDIVATLSKSSSSSTHPPQVEAAQGPSGATEQPSVDPTTETATWVHVASADTMSAAVSRIASARICDCIIIDCPITASPQELASTFRAAGLASLRIDCILTVLDSSYILDDLDAADAAEVSAVPDSAADTAVPDVAAPVPDSCTDASALDDDYAKSHAMHVVLCVENANVIAVTRNSNFDPVHSVLSALNHTAQIIQFDAETPVPLTRVVNTNLYNPETVALNATWRRVLLASRDDDPKSLKALPRSAKEASFVYRARRPFHPTRFYEHIKDVTTFSGVFRSTGSIWLPTRMSAPLEWEQAGDSATLRAGKSFWAATPEQEWNVSEATREIIMKNWDNQYGDRQTEMVFVGRNFDKDRLQGLLDGCLLQDEEMVFTKLWDDFSDPFEQWVPLDDDSDDERNDEEDAASRRAQDAAALAAADAAAEAAVSAAVAAADVASGAAAAIAFAEAGAIPVVSIDAEIVDVMMEESDAENVFVAASDITDNEHAGEVDSSTLPEDVLAMASALDVFELAMSGGEDCDDEEEGTSGEPSTPPARYSQPADDGSFNLDDVVISSWDAAVADGIIAQMPKVGLPVTIVTGFLGAGKTTLLNYILTADHGLKIAVLVNEFGEVDIDNQLIEKGDWSSEDEVMELANGCICCSINDSFVDAVRKILEKKDMVDYLIVETTGVADPVPVINSLMVSDIAEDVRVDGILTLVDAENFDVEAHMGSEAALSQILAADTILLSKTDIASPKAVQQTIDYIKEVRPAARILKSQRGRIPVGMILDVGMRVSNSPAAMEPVKKELEHSLSHIHDHDKECTANCSDPSHDHSSRKSERGCEPEYADPTLNHSENHPHSCDSECTDPTHDHSHNHMHPPSGNNHLEADGFVSTSFKSDIPLVAELFMEKFLQHLPEGVFRAKGLLSFYGYEPRYVFNLSGRRYQFEEDDWPEGIAPGNQLVIIGRDLDINALQRTLAECVAPNRFE
jgi:G3E family GTPase